MYNHASTITELTINYLLSILTILVDPSSN